MLKSVAFIQKRSLPHSLQCWRACDVSTTPARVWAASFTSAPAEGVPTASVSARDCDATSSKLWNSSVTTARQSPKPGMKGVLEHSLLGRRANTFSASETPLYGERSFSSWTEASLTEKHPLVGTGYKFWFTKARQEHKRQDREGHLEQLKELEVVDAALERNKKYMAQKEKYEGLRNMDELPSIMFVADPYENMDALKEAEMMNIPVIAIVDGRETLPGCVYPIVGNPGSLKFVHSVMDTFVQVLQPITGQAGLVNFHKAVTTAISAKQQRKKEERAERKMQRRESRRRANARLRRGT